MKNFMKSVGKVISDDRVIVALGILLIAIAESKPKNKNHTG